MNGYESSTPRIALGLTAVALAAITMGTLVVLPAMFDSMSAEPYSVAAAKAATNAPIEIAIMPARIDEPEMVTREEHVKPDCATLGAQPLHGKRHRSTSRCRANT